MSGFHFTERARAMFARAAAESNALAHEYVGTEHLLLALLDDDDSVPAAVFAAFHVDRARVRGTILQIVSRGTAAPAAGAPRNMPYTSRAKRALELATAEAHRLRHDYVGPEHVLLGLLAEAKGIAAQVLTDAGVTLDATRAEIARLLGEPRDDRPAPSIRPARPAPVSAAAMPTGPRDVNETQAWLRLRSALEITRLLGGTPTLRREADGTLVASLGDALEITIPLPPDVAVRERGGPTAPEPGA